MKEGNVVHQRINARIVPNNEVVHIECTCGAITPIRLGHTKEARCISCEDRLTLNSADEAATQQKDGALRGPAAYLWPKF